MTLRIRPKVRPVLDPEFLPAALWLREYGERVAAAGGGARLAVALERADGAVSVFHTRILPHEGDCVAVNQRYAERLLKFLLWQKGG